MTTNHNECSIVHEGPVARSAIFLASLILSLASALLVGSAIAEAEQAAGRLPTTRGLPDAFGVDSYGVTTVSAVAFKPEGGDARFPENYIYGTSPSLGRYGASNIVENFYATLTLPAGVVIDYVGLNSTSAAPFALGVGLYRRARTGDLSTIVEIDSTVHDWDTDFNVSALNYQWRGEVGEALILKVQQGAFEDPPFFGWAEVWWRRVVSPAPFPATFNDVSPRHAFYQYIEALAASGITVGCGSGNYCPDSAVTRGQMAVFLAKALGLHWPN